MGGRLTLLGLALLWGYAAGAACGYGIVLGWNCGDTLEINIYQMPVTPAQARDFCLRFAGPTLACGAGCLAWLWLLIGSPAREVAERFVTGALVALPSGALLGFACWLWPSYWIVRGVLVTCLCIYAVCSCSTRLGEWVLGWSLVGYCVALGTAVVLVWLLSLRGHPRTDSIPPGMKAHRRALIVPGEQGPPTCRRSAGSVRLRHCCTYSS